MNGEEDAEDVEVKGRLKEEEEEAGKNKRAIGR